MIVIVGLGNPGEVYARTRHNVGFAIVDHLADRHSLQFSAKSRLQAEIAKDNHLLLIKPLTYMNRSGDAVRATLDYFSVNSAPDGSYPELYVVHDDLDLPVGTYKVQLGTGPKQHNGLLSIYDHLHTKQFWHVRVGVDGRMGDRSIPPDRYVLQQPSMTEQQLLSQLYPTIERLIPIKNF